MGGVVGRLTLDDFDGVSVCLRAAAWQRGTARSLAKDPRDLGRMAASYRVRNLR